MQKRPAYMDDAMIRSLERILRSIQDLQDRVEALESERIGNAIPTTPEPPEPPRAGRDGDALLVEAPGGEDSRAQTTYQPWSPGWWKDR